MVHHNGCVVQRRMHLVVDDGGEGEIGPGDVFVLPPGHAAWVVGDEQCIVRDFAGGMATDYAKAGESRERPTGAVTFRG